MSKTIRVIDLFSKIANGEEVPKKIQYEDREYYFNVNTREYIYFDEEDCINRYFIDLLRCTDLNDNVEIIEEQEEIDIQSIEELDENFTYIENHSSGLGIEKVLNKAEIELVNKINKLAQAVKQLEREINKLKEKK